jgi:Tol biopolymer transport system component
MKHKTIFIGILVLVILIFSNCARKGDFPILKGPYLGQEPPGMTPELFAPGIVCTDETQGCSVFLEDGRIFMYNVFREDESFLYELEMVVEHWTKPRLSSLTSDYYDGDFTLSPDGKTLFFSSRRPLKLDGTEREYSDIWMVNRTETGWGQPSPLGAPINTEHHDAYPTLEKDGTLYFFARDRGGYGKSDIFCSRLVEGAYQEPENLGPAINSDEHEWDPWIAPDGSFLIFCSTKPGGYGGDDIYVSFREMDGSWCNAINMGRRVNSAKSENRPYVTWDSKYFFFASNRSGNGNIYWVDAKIIEKLKPEELNPCKARDL